MNGSLLLATYLSLTHLLRLSISQQNSNLLNLKKSIIATTLSSSILNKENLKATRCWGREIEPSIIPEGLDENDERVRRLCYDEDEDYGAEYEELEHRQKLSQNEEEEQEVVLIKPPSFCSNKEPDSPANSKTQPNILSMSGHEKHSDNENGLNIYSESSAAKKYFCRSED